MRSAIVEDGHVTNVIIGTVPSSIPCGDDVGIGWTYDGERFIAPETPEPVFDLSAYTAEKRWQKEVGGTVWGGYPVHTDRESQAKIIAERLAIEAGERLDPDGWKFADGVFRMVSNEDFVELSNAVREHVRDCYATEAAVLEQIGAGTITTTAEIDAAFA